MNKANTFGDTKCLSICSSPDNNLNETKRVASLTPAALPEWIELLDAGRLDR